MHNAHQATLDYIKSKADKILDRGIKSGEAERDIFSASFMKGGVEVNPDIKDVVGVHIDMKYDRDKIFDKKKVEALEEVWKKKGNKNEI